MESLRPTSIDHIGELVATTDRQDWRQPLINRLSDEALLEDTTEASCLSRKVKSFVIIDGSYSKRNISASGIQAKVHPIQRGTLVAHRSAKRNERAPCSPTLARRQGIQARILLANGHGRRRTTRDKHIC